MHLYIIFASTRRHQATTFSDAGQYRENPSAVVVARRRIFKRGSPPRSPAGSQQPANERERERGEKGKMSRSSAAERYEKLGLAEALGRPSDYPAACGELGLILRRAYSKLPKGVQSLVFSDTVSAFRRLPEVGTSFGMSAAHSLVQAAEAVLPKQKKSVAVSEFKRAVVAHKRNSKGRQEGDYLELPEDALIHIFSFMDLQSLVTASLVCWQWNTAASDDMLWKLQYYFYFENYDLCCKSTKQANRLSQEKKDIFRPQTTKDMDPITNISWREAFKRKYIGNPTLRFSSGRAFCESCGSIIWLSSVTRARSHCSRKIETQQVEVRPIPTNKVLEYLLFEEPASDSDSDSEESAYFSKQMMRLWVFPRFTEIL